MQKLSIYIYLCIILFLVQISCTKDKGNYTYSELNSVLINTEDSIFTIEQFDKLTINPTLVESKPSDNDTYSYEWIAYPSQTSNTFTQIVDKESGMLLSTKKDLDTIMPFAPKKYYLQYNVINNNTGIKSIKRFTVNITAAFYEGWLVMNNVNNQGKLSFIRKDGRVYLDPFMEANNMPLKGKALASYAAVTGQMKEVYVFTDQEVIKVNANDLVLSGAQNNIFSLPPNTQSPFYAISASGLEQYIVANGKVHATTTPTFGLSKYSSPFGGQSAKLFPFVFFGSSIYISFYDNNKKRFLQSGFFGRSLQTFSYNINNKYDLANVGKTMVAADLGYQNEFYTIMKDDNNKYYFYGYTPFLNVQAASYQEIQNSPDIAQAVSFASSSSVQHIYYATESKIYLYDILANSARLLYQFPTGTHVKMMSMYKHKGWGMTSLVDPDFNRLLVVAANTGTEGRVYYFKIDPTGTFTNQTYSQVFEGFGEIEHINYRNKNEQ